MKRWRPFFGAIKLVPVLLAGLLFLAFEAGYAVADERETSS